MKPAALLLVFTVLLPGWGQAQRMPSHCFAIAGNELPQDLPQDITFAAFGEGLDQSEVRISYIQHSTYLIETAGGIGIATDFTGDAGPGGVPTVVTMNRAHSSHWTAYPDPAIPHVLPGWGEGGGKAEYWLELGDEVLIRNVTTDIRSGFVGVVPDGNSIFIFEVAGLCIGHLGHLHHEPSEEQYAAIGRLDVVMAPVDGGMTLDLPTMIRVLKRLRAQIVLPMHWFGPGNLEVFVAGMADEFRVVRVGGKPIVVSLRTLPSSPEIRVLLPRVAGDGFD